MPLPPATRAQRRCDVRQWVIPGVTLFNGNSPAGTGLWTNATGMNHADAGAFASANGQALPSFWMLTSTLGFSIPAAADGGVFSVVLRVVGTSLEA